MGFPLQTIMLILNEHRAHPLEGPLLTLGRQTINGSYKQILQLFKVAELEPVPLPPNVLQSDYLDELLFAHMGLESQTLDVSDFEHADIIHNLNEPIDEAYHGKFRTIVDGGTIEHIFDVRTGFANIVDLLAPGGRIIHITPCNNYVNHGFWQVSPTSFFDFYEANGFTDLHAQMIVHPRDRYLARRWASFPYDRDRFGFVNSLFSSKDDQLVCMFSARKTAASTGRVVPTQSFFTKAEQAAKDGTVLDGLHFTLEYTDEELFVREVPMSPT